jgi:hypothetical protein
VSASVCAPAGFCATRSVESTCPLGSTSVAATLAATVRVYETAAVSPGATVEGEAAGFWTASATTAPSEPVAERAPGVAIAKR